MRVHMRKTGWAVLLTLAILVNMTGCGTVPDSVSGYKESRIPAEIETNGETFGEEPYEVVNDNRPFFTEEEKTAVSFESYSELDDLGRCGPAFASIGPDLMPEGERENIGSVKPSGWHTVKYDQVDGKYLYNRCHLIGYQLTGENANERNLITGTRYMNVEGMLPFENMTADYIKETGNHVLYRVTPEFEGEELVARGVLMEAESVEDGGEGIRFCVFVYNRQPGIAIDYATGDSRLASEDEPSGQTDETAEEAYIVNTNTGKFHLPGCGSVQEMDPSNRLEFEGSREELISQGYEPCGRCRP